MKQLNFDFENLPIRIISHHEIINECLMKKISRDWLEYYSVELMGTSGLDDKTNFFIYLSGNKNPVDTIAVIYHGIQMHSFHFAKINETESLKSIYDDLYDNLGRCLIDLTKEDYKFWKFMDMVKSCYELNIETLYANARIPKNYT